MSQNNKPKLSNEKKDPLRQHFPPSEQFRLFVSNNYECSKSRAPFLDSLFVKIYTLHTSSPYSSRQTRLFSPGIRMFLFATPWSSIALLTGFILALLSHRKTHFSEPLSTNHIRHYLTSAARMTDRSTIRALAPRRIPFGSEYHYTRSRFVFTLTLFCQNSASSSLARNEHKCIRLVQP